MTWQTRRVLVTGATGIAGLPLVNRHLAEGEAVAALVRHIHGGAANALR